MVKYTLKRLLMAVVTLWVIITMTFVLMHAIPGNPFADEKRIQPEIMANLNAKYGLDKPLIEQYGIYMSNLVRGDFGVSLKYQNRTVNSLIAQGFPVSMTLGAAACVTGKLKWTNNGKEKSPTKYSLLSIMLVNIILERRKGNGEGKNVQRNTSLQANRIYNQEVCSSNRNRQKDSPKVLEYERRRIFKISGREP